MQLVFFLDLDFDDFDFEQCTVQRTDMYVFCEEAAAHMHDSSEIHQGCLFNPHFLVLSLPLSSVAVVCIYLAVMTFSVTLSVPMICSSSSMR